MGGFAVIALLTLIYGAYNVIVNEESSSTSNSESVEESTSTSNFEPVSTNKPTIHAKSARNRIRKEARKAEDKLDRWKSQGYLKKAAEESHFLADSLEKMFSSNQYFRGNIQIDSYPTAISAAEEARDNLLEARKRQTYKVDSSGLTPNSIENEYIRNAILSELMIVWCASGLIGRAKAESAQKIFHVNVSLSDVQTWSRFKKLLEREWVQYR
jgi:hypothetical protein